MYESLFQSIYKITPQPSKVQDVKAFIKPTSQGKKPRAIITPKPAPKTIVPQKQQTALGNFTQKPMVTVIGVAVAILLVCFLVYKSQQQAKLIKTLKKRAKRANRNAKK